MSEDYIHVDKAVEVALENGWLSAEDIANYIDANRNVKPFISKLKEFLEKKGFSLREIPTNPSERVERK